jgi:hypothetical protein
VRLPTRRLAAWAAARAPQARLPRDSADEALRGWRAWQVVEGREGPTLASWWLGTLWPARQELTAGCHMHGSRPAAHHACGIHAFGTRQRALALVADRSAMPLLFARTPARSLGIVVGRVSGWGRVVRHTHGWRSQYAYPFDLELLSGDHALARRIADRYAVETLLQTSRTEVPAAHTIKEMDRDA